MPKCFLQHSRSVRSDTPSAAQVSLKNRNGSAASRSSNRGHDVSMMASRRRFFVGPFQKTFDQRVQQLLLKPMYRLRVGECSCTCFGHPYRGPLVVEQFPYRRTRRPAACRRRNHEQGSVYSTAIIG
jgi:hypothetical protein